MTKCSTCRHGVQTTTISGSPPDDGSPSRVDGYQHLGADILATLKEARWGTRG